MERAKPEAKDLESRAGWEASPHKFPSAVGASFPGPSGSRGLKEHGKERGKSRKKEREHKDRENEGSEGEDSGTGRKA